MATRDVELVVNPMTAAVEEDAREEPLPSEDTDMSSAAPSGGNAKNLGLPATTAPQPLDRTTAKDWGARKAKVRRLVAQSIALVAIVSFITSAVAFAMGLAATIAVADERTTAAAATGWGAHADDFEVLRAHLPLHFGQLVDVPTVGARDCEFFSADGNLYLVYANDKNNAGSHDVGSTVWRFNRADRSFTLVQTIATHAAHDADAMVISGVTYLVLASKAGATSLYKWNAGQFVLHQTFHAESDTKSEKFYVRDVDHHAHNGVDWLALIVSEAYPAGSATKSNSANSELWKWDAGSAKFVWFKDVPSVGARDGEFFVVDGVLCIAIANTKSATGAERIIESFVYKFDADASAWLASDPIVTEGAYDFEYVASIRHLRFSRAQQWSLCSLGLSRTLFSLSSAPAPVRPLSFFPSRAQVLRASNAMPRSNNGGCARRGCQIPCRSVLDEWYRERDRLEALQVGRLEWSGERVARVSADADVRSVSPRSAAALLCARPFALVHLPATHCFSRSRTLVAVQVRGA